MRINEQHRRGVISLYVWAAIALVALICILGILRQTNKLIHPKPPHFKTLGPCEVLSAENGAALLVKIRRRERLVLLQYCEAPAPGPMAEESRKQLETLAGGTVTVQWQRRLLASENVSKEDLRWFEEHVKTCPMCAREPTAELPEPWCDEAMDRASGLEARGPIVGTVFGASGIDLNAAMIESGYADATDDAPRYLQKAKKAAQKAKLGIWAEERL